MLIVIKNDSRASQSVHKTKKQCVSNYQLIYIFVIYTYIFIFEEKD